MEIHNKTVDNLVPLRKGKAIDFLNEEYMTPGQIKSFENILDFINAPNI